MATSTTSFHMFSITIQMIFIIPQCALYLVGDLAGVNLSNVNLAWYSFFARYLSFDYIFYIGLQGYIVITSSPDAINPILPSLQNASFIQKCDYAGRNAIILTSITLFLSVILAFLIYRLVFYRLLRKEDQDQLRLASFMLSITTFGLGLAAYLHFYDHCITRFNNYLHENGFYDIDGSISSRGGSMIGAIVCNFIIMVVIFIEILLAFFGVDGRTQSEDNQVKNQEMVAVATPV